MDPRVAARRRQVRVENMQRRRRRMLAVVVLAAVAGLVYTVVQSPLFSVTGVRVTGVERPQSKQVRAAADVAVGQNLLDVDLGEVSTDVEQLPWVADTKVTRQPPATIVVHVTPRVPVATVTSAAGNVIVDAGGVVIAAAADRHLVSVLAPDAVLPPAGDAIADPAVLEALAVHAGLSSALRSEIARYRVIDAAYVVADLDVGRRQSRTVSVRFGGSQRLGEKEQSLAALLLRLEREDLLDDGVTVDVRAPSNPVVAAY